MANLRIIYDNVADSAELTASSEAGLLAVENLTTDRKSVGWRATGTSATLTAVWTEGQTIAAVVLPFTNLTPSATIRVRGYTDSADLVPAYDSGAVAACPAAQAVLRGWAAGQDGANAYAYGGGAAARIWFAAGLFEKLVIDLADSTNPAGYIEASRLVIGDYWSPAHNAEAGMSMTLVDTSKHSRTESGDIVTDVGFRYRKLPLNLGYLPPTDRTAVMNILRGNGMPTSVFISVFPGHSNLELERDHQIYGRLSTVSAVSIPYTCGYSYPLDIEEV